jgi:hypothetical protein
MRTRCTLCGVKVKRLTLSRVLLGSLTRMTSNTNYQVQSLLSELAPGPLLDS